MVIIRNQQQLLQTQWKFHNFIKRRKNSMKRLIALFLILSLCVGIMVIPASAEESTNSGTSLSTGNTDSVKAAGPPSIYYNLSTPNAYYTAVLQDLDAAWGSYTLKYFSTGTGNIYIKCNLLRSGTTNPMSRKLTVKLYKRQTSSGYGTFVSEENIYFSSDGTYRRAFMHLDTNYFYYIYFYNSSAAYSGSNQAISGTIIIDDEYQ